MTCSLLVGFFRPQVVNKPQPGLFMLLEENTNHVWSDLSGAFFRPEVDVNMPQTGLFC